MVDVSSYEENVQPDGKGENRFENIYMVITETEESSSGSMEIMLSQCLEELESDNDNDNFDNMFLT